MFYFICGFILSILSEKSEKSDNMADFDNMAYLWKDVQKRLYIAYVRRTHENKGNSQ